MPKRPSKCYREQKQQAYTRRKYMQRVPDVPEGLRKLTYGNKKKFDFPAIVKLVAQKDIQVSASSLEAVRIAVNRELKVLGEENYRFQIKSAPHHVVREHGLVGVAKAERFVKGMRLSFGKCTRRMARVKKEKTIIEIRIPDEAVSYHVCLKALRLARMKLSGKWKVENEGVSKENILARPTLPKRVKETKKQ